LKKKPSLATFAGTALGIVAAALLFKGYSDYRERQIAEQAVRRVAGDAELVWLVDRFTSGRGKHSHRTLWCGRIDRENGDVAVQTVGYSLPLLNRVLKVETAWTAPRVLAEESLLYQCWTYRS
jgi:hypothetical protein